MRADQFPTTTAPEVAMLGRSNVGKSSLLNALVGASVARVSSTPGRTRAINFFSLATQSSPSRPRLVLADLPGYGYAKISRSISAGWPAFIDPYLAERPQLALCLCLVDSNIPAQKSDLQLLDWLRERGRMFLVVATKADKLSGNQRTRNLAQLKSSLGVEELLPVSSKTGLGLTALTSRLDDLATLSHDAC